MKIRLCHVTPVGLIRMFWHFVAGWRLCRHHGVPLRAYIPNCINPMTAVWNLSRIMADMPPPATIIDAGANSSQMSRLLLLLCRPETRVLSFEPIPSLKPIGERFFQALSDKDGMADFYVPGGNDDELGSLYKDYFETAGIGARTLRVELARFDTLVRQGKVPWDDLNRPILLKIDTEGSELNVMKGFGALLSGVDYIVSEVSNSGGRSRPYDLTEMCGYLASAGFHNSRMLYACVDGPALSAYMDMFFWRSGTPEGGSVTPPKIAKVSQDSAGTP